MAEINPELDAINHLLEVEKNASALINDAQIEADKRIQEARAKYNTEYKTKYDSIAASMESDYQKAHQEIEAKYKKEIEDYKVSLENKPQNQKAFTDLLEKIIFA